MKVQKRLSEDEGKNSDIGLGMRLDLAEEGYGLKFLQEGIKLLYQLLLLIKEQ